MIENLSSYEFFYVNGCSHVEGGGLEHPSIRPADSILGEYEKKYGVTWESRDEVNFGKRLSEIIGIPCFNDAKSGSGTDRVVRTTYDFIYKNWDKRNKFFLILENPDPRRCDVFLKEINDYFIVNIYYDEENKSHYFGNTSREYYNNKYKKDDKLFFDVLKYWTDNHFNFDEKLINDDKSFIGLYSFCKMVGIKIFVMDTTNYLFSDCFSSDDIINFNDESYSRKDYGISSWCYNYGYTIKDELDNITEDGHPGYFGHIEYAKQMAKFLGWSGDFKINKKKYIKKLL